MGNQECYKKGEVGIFGNSSASRIYSAMMLMLLTTGLIQAQCPGGMAGAGTAGDPCVITDVGELQAMEDALGFQYILGNDIDASGLGVQGFQPVGDGGTPFTGSFDGQGYLIQDLVVNQNNSDAGMFGVTGATAVIMNTGLVNADISGHSETGALVGNNAGTIQQAYVTGIVSTNNVNIGGLVGRNTGTIENSYSAAEVYGVQHIGGLVGRNSGGTVNNTYSLGVVEANSANDNGLIGSNGNGGIITNSFWDTDNSGTMVSEGGTGKTTAEMQDINTFTNTATAGLDVSWDMADLSALTGETWAIDDNNTYPYLAWQEVPFRTTENLNVWTDTEWEIGSQDGNWKPTIAVPGVDDHITILHDITLNQNLNFEGTLVFSEGILTTSNANKLTITAAGRVTEGNAGSYVDGPLQVSGKEAFVYPIGNSGRWARLAISGAGAGDQFTAQYHNEPHSNLTSLLGLVNISVLEYWTLTRDAGSSAIDLTLYWEDGNSSGIDDLNDLRIAHYNSSLSGWENLGQYTTNGDNVSGSITVSNVNNFSPFTLASEDTEDNPLPVELLYFNAGLTVNGTLLEWATASEINNEQFRVQRSTDGKSWEDIAVISGQGYSASTVRYEMTDKDVFQVSGSYVFYRLRQEDYDGTYEYSPIRYIEKEADYAGDLHAFPNPFDGALNLKFTLQKAKTVYAEIYNTDGRLINRKSRDFPEGKQVWDTGHLLEGHLPGIYIVRVNREGYVRKVRVSYRGNK